MLAYIIMNYDDVVRIELSRLMLYDIIKILLAIVKPGLIIINKILSN